MRAAVIVSLLALSAATAGCGASSGPARHVQPKPLGVYADGVKLGELFSVRGTIRLPHRLSITHGPARIEVGLPRARISATIRRALRAHETRVDVPFTPLASSIRIRPVLQVLHNDCEATSLSMLLTAVGVHANQLRLQGQLPKSRPLDPQPVAGSTLFRWGDPERGFVGRADGRGPGGGFGVYEPPIRALAARYGIHLVDLRGRSVSAVKAAVLAGHPVLAWVGLSAGPYKSWLTPSGHAITVNFGEHAVVLVGADRYGFLVNNPLTGRETWSDALFSYRWQLLGRRALELP